MTKKLWMDGNGRISCSDLRCAGQTAHANNMTYDLNGAEMVPVDLAVVKEFQSAGLTAKCETCRAEASVLA